MNFDIYGDGHGFRDTWSRKRQTTQQRLPAISPTCNYFVPVTGHIAWFEQYEDALRFADDFGSYVFSTYGLLARG